VEIAATSNRGGSRTDSAFFCRTLTKMVISTNSVFKEVGFVSSPKAERFVRLVSLNLAKTNFWSVRVRCFWDRPRRAGIRRRTGRDKNKSSTWPWPVFRLKRTKFLSYFALKRPKFRSWFRYMEENSQISLIPKRNFSKFQKFLAPPSGVCKEEGTKEKQEMWFLE